MNEYLFLKRTFVLVMKVFVQRDKPWLCVDNGRMH